ncbi:MULTISPECIES: DsbA family oxidoreductase [Sphingobacterium]|uniref:DsbA family oxidoreductase n=1 Tax=Sphingobacterium TaxID=28453 RepID=UPI00038A057D|nr:MULTISPECIES: DsbA family oxidoreductase [Sphingobacterium]KKX51975.1 DSBA oxidoreductase [Sphingobacterium sp. IITKGP-BTPF85]MCW2260414.1 putative DsbA family dithiol-disulfide isomerase [Sphingobacterium kitahiroshimense]NJI71703.1 DsbA family oxidoreductase [Sphingobacterium sp. B16(2022)]TCR05486.1 putative DsbA family dithiol-disulfide isomerase [Sphingobacterium sp. JUb78]
MKIEIWSDIVCPFCYIGKKRLEQALASFPHRDEVEIIWKSYQLHPQFPQDAAGIPAVEYIKNAKGLTKEETLGMMQQVQSIGKSLEIDFDFEKSLIVNTLNGHRLIHFAQEHGLGNILKERLLKAHFSEGVDVNDTNILVNLAAEVGMDKKEVQEMLFSDRFTYEVTQDIQEGVNLGLRGVPFFVFNQKFGIAGAQPLEMFEQTLRQAYEDAKTVIIMNDNEGPSCDSETGNC